MGGIYQTLEQKNSHCVLIEVQKAARCTCQAKMVVGSSLTPSVALSLCPSGTIHLIVDNHEFKLTWLSAAISLLCMDSAIVRLSCQAKNWISVLVLVCLDLVFANPVTYDKITI